MKEETKGEGGKFEKVLVKSLVKKRLGMHEMTLSTSEWEKGCTSTTKRKERERKEFHDALVRMLCLI